MNKKIIVEAIKTAIFINDEFTQNNATVSVNNLFFSFTGKDKVKKSYFVE